MTLKKTLFGLEFWCTVYSRESMIFKLKSIFVLQLLQTTRHFSAAKNIDIRF